MTSITALERKEVVGVEESVGTLAKPAVAFIVMALDGDVLDRPVHPFDLSVAPRMVRFRQSVIEVVLSASQRARIASEQRLLFEQLLDLGRSPAVALGVGDVRAVWMR